MVQASTNEGELMVRETREGLYINTDDSPFWYVAVYVDGKRRRVSTKEKDFERAKRKAHQLRQEVIRKSVKKTLKQDFVETLEEWIELKSKRWSLGTTKDVIGKLKVAKDFFASYAVDEINEHSWEEFLGFMEETYPGRRVSKIQDYLASFLIAQHQRGFITRVPTLKDPNSESEIGRVLHPEEITSLLEHCKSSKLRLQVLMQLRMGMRIGEVMKLAVSRIDWRSGVIRLRAEDTKTRKGRVIPIHPEVLDLLRAQVKSHGRPYVFPGKKDPNKSLGSQGNKSAFRTLQTLAGVKCRKHDLRHTCATQFSRDKIDPVVACRILGMSLQVYDRIYCKPNEDDLKAAFAPKATVEKSETTGTN